MTPTVVDHAQSEDLLFILRRARVTIVDRSLDWTGVDRFRLRAGRAIEDYVTFDTQPLRDALTRVARKETQT